MWLNGEFAIGLVWIGWALAWAAAIPWSASTAAMAPGQWRYRIVTIAAFVLTLGYYSHAARGGFLILYRAPAGLQWAMAGCTLLSVCFGMWARLTLGRNWSASVQRKQDHQVIEAGPYALVRHPMYTGLISAALATAIAKGSIPAWAGAACFIFGYHMKAKLEEKFLRQELGAAAYDAYAARVPMLVPFTKF